MKLLILTCLVAIALARPKHPHRQLELVRNEPDSRELTPRELRQEHLSELSRQRELLRETQNDEPKNKSTDGHVMEDPEQRETSSSSSSEEVVPNNTQEQLHRLSKYNQLQLEALRDQQQLRRVTESNHIQLPFQQFYQLDAYPYAVWYYPPQVMQYIAYTPFYDVTKLTAPENTENVGVVPEW
uniref:Alpha-S1-casein n=1 Tax=Lynx canadensis TaxID=61383 RepID=A0A667GHK6_LYNCA